MSYLFKFGRLVSSLVFGFLSIFETSVVKEGDPCKNPDCNGKITEVKTRHGNVVRYTCSEGHDTFCCGYCS